LYSSGVTFAENEIQPKIPATMYNMEAKPVPITITFLAFGKV
jgi:hypothetical protein